MDISINFLQNGHILINIPVTSVIVSQMRTFVWFNLMCDANKACQNEQGLKAQKNFCHKTVIPKSYRQIESTEISCDHSCDHINL